MMAPMQIDDAIMPPGVDLTEWDDFPKKRQAIFDSVKNSFLKKFPVSYGGVRMELHDAHYTDPEEYSLSEQKKALMTDKFLNRRLRGNLKLFDEKSGQQLDETGPITLIRVPWLTQRGTVVHGGNEWTTISQARLLPGVYTRRKQNSEVESHFNARRSTGHSFRIRLEPDTGLFKMDIGQSSLRLYSLLKDIGVKDEDLEKTWGPDLLKTNRDAYDKRVFEKAYQRLVRRPDPNATPEQKAAAIRDALAATKLDRSVVERTLPNLFRAKVPAADRRSASKSAAVAGRQPLPGLLDDGSSGVLGQNEGHSNDLNKSDLLLLAYVLDQKLGAGIPMEESTDQLVDDIMEALHEQAPSVNPDMLRFMIDSKKEAA